MTIETHESDPAVRIFDYDKGTVLYADAFMDSVLLTIENVASEAVLGQIIVTSNEIQALGQIMAELQEIGVIAGDAPVPVDSEPDEADFIDFEPLPTESCPICEIEKELPTEIGAYLDAEGDVWILSGDGHWYDSYGDTQEPAYNYHLVEFGPFTRIPNASELFKR